jgi:Fe2+ transport system protein B
VPKKAVDTKYKIILGHEQSMARSIAASLIQPKQITVWEIMIPVIFILNFAKIKQSREVFIQNHLFTKNMALKAAFDMNKKGLGRQEVMDRIESQTKKTLASAPETIYSDEIRREQVKEIELLLDHYGRIFTATGQNYPVLVVDAYQTRENYAAFYQQLKAAENDVMMAARRTLGDQADNQAADRLEEITDRIRAAGVNKIFNTDSRP